jgi:hypothetical protein
MKHKTEKFWLASHVDDMPCAGTTGGLELTVELLKKKFEITTDKNPTLILGVQVERNRTARTMKLHQENYSRALLEKYGMTNCNPRSTPLEAAVTAEIRQILKASKESTSGTRERKGIPMF